GSRERMNAAASPGSSARTSSARPSRRQRITPSAPAGSGCASRRSAVHSTRSSAPSGALHSSTAAGSSYGMKSFSTTARPPASSRRSMPAGVTTASRNAAATWSAFITRSGCSHTSVAAPSSVPAAKPRRPASVNGPLPSVSVIAGRAATDGSGSASAGSSGSSSDASSRTPARTLHALRAHPAEEGGELHAAERLGEGGAAGGLEEEADLVGDRVAGHEGEASGRGGRLALEPVVDLAAVEPRHADVAEDDVE